MNKKGFTTVELILVTALVALFATLIVPKLFVVRDSVKAKALLVDLHRTVDEAANRAASSGQAVALKIDSGQVTLSTIDDNGDETQYKQTPLPDGTTITATRVNGTDVSQDDWELKVFPDGQSSAAELEITTPTGSICLQRDPLGKPLWRAGKLADQPKTLWEAGDIEQRFGS